MKKLFQISSIVLTIAMILTGCNLKKASKEPDEYKNISSKQPATSSSENSSQESDEDLEKTVFTIKTISEKHPKAKDLHLEAALTTGIAEKSAFAEKLKDRKITTSDDQPLALPLLHFGYLGYAETKDGKKDDSIKKTSDGSVTIPINKLENILSQVYDDTTFVGSLAKSMAASKEYADTEKNTLLLKSDAYPVNYLPEEFTVKIIEKDDKLEVAIFPTKEKPCKDLVALHYTYKITSAKENPYRLLSATLETEDSEPQKTKFDDLTNISHKLNEKPDANMEIIGSVDNKPVAIERWNQILTIAIYNDSFKEEKRVSFEYGYPLDIEFRDSRIILKFARQVVVLDSSLSILHSATLPQFMIDYQNAFPVPQYENNTAQNLEFYSYDISNDYRQFLYASGKGMYLYDTGTQKQFPIIASKISGGSLQTPMNVKFTADGTEGWGVQELNGNRYYVQYDIASRKTTELSSGEVSTKAKDPKYTQLGTFFTGDISYIGKAHYVDVTRAGKGDRTTLGFLTAPGTTQTYPVFDEWTKFTALLDDGRLIYTRGTEVFCTATPRITAPEMPTPSTPKPSTPVPETTPSTPSSSLMEPSSDDQKVIIIH